MSLSGEKAEHKWARLSVSDRSTDSLAFSFIGNSSEFPIKEKTSGRGAKCPGDICSAPTEVERRAHERMR